MSEYKEIIFNAQTGEVTERPYTKEEIDEAKKQEAKIKSYFDELAAKDNARQSALAKLAALGLTEYEIAALQDYRRLHFRRFTDHG